MNKAMLRRAQGSGFKIAVLGVGLFAGVAVSDSTHATSQIRKESAFAIGVAVAPEQVAIEPLTGASRAKRELSVAVSQPTEQLSSAQRHFIDAEGRQHVVLKMQLKSLQAEVAKLKRADERRTAAESPLAKQVEDIKDQLTKLSTLVAARLGATPASTTTLAEVKQTQVDDVRPPAADAQPHVHEMPHPPHPPHHAPAKQHSSRLAELRNGHDYGHDADMDAIFGDESSREELDDESSNPHWRDGHAQLLKEAEQRRVLAAQPKKKELSVEKTLEQLPLLPGIPRPVKSKLILSESQEKAVENELAEAHDLRISLAQPQTSAAETMLQATLSSLKANDDTDHSVDLKTIF